MSDSVCFSAFSRRAVEAESVLSMLRLFADEPELVDEACRRAYADDSVGMPDVMIAAIALSQGDGGTDSSNPTILYQQWADVAPAGGSTNRRSMLPSKLDRR